VGSPIALGLVERAALDANTFLIDGRTAHRSPLPFHRTSTRVLTGRENRR
jgi:hypothetical protein